jgi:hypothetical protein
MGPSSFPMAALCAAHAASSYHMYMRRSRDLGKWFAAVCAYRFAESYETRLRNTYPTGPVAAAAPPASR